jgi:hypothetical protein
LTALLLCAAIRPGLTRVDLNDLVVIGKFLAAFFWAGVLEERDARQAA